MLVHTHTCVTNKACGSRVHNTLYPRRLFLRPLPSVHVTTPLLLLKHDVTFPVPCVPCVAADGARDWVLGGPCRPV